MRFKRLILFIVSILVLTALVAGCDKKKKVDEFVIGAQNPETGQIAIYGTQTVAGVKLAIDEVNAAGGINGKLVRLINYDSRGDKTEAVNITKRLLNAKVCGIVGETTSGAFFSMRDTAERGKTIAISSGATAKGVTDGRPFIFRNTLQDADGGPAIIEYAINKNKYKKFALITAVNNDYSVGLSEVFKEAINAKGGEIVLEQTVADGDTDVSAQITSLRGKPIDAIVFSGYYQEAALLLLEMNKQGLKLPLIGGDGFQSPDLWKVAGDNSIGTIFFAGFAANAPVAEIIEFGKKMKERDVEPDMFAAQGYDAANLIMLAIKNSGVPSCDTVEEREKVRKSMSEIVDFGGVSGKMSFDSEGSAVKKPFIQEVIKVDGVFTTKLLN